MVENGNITVYDNDIDELLHEYYNNATDEEIRSSTQNVWNGCLRYICKKLFRNTRLLKDPNSRYNEYNYNLLLDIVDYYIDICSYYDKECSIVGYSYLTNIDKDTIYLWSNDKDVTSMRISIYKKLMNGREESLSAKLATANKNPVGIIAILNRHYGWSSPYTNQPQAKQSSLSSSDLPQLAQIPDEKRD